MHIILCFFHTRLFALLAHALQFFFRTRFDFAFSSAGIVLASEYVCSLFQILHSAVTINEADTPESVSPLVFPIFCD